MGIEFTTSVAVGDADLGPVAVTRDLDVVGSLDPVGTWEDGESQEPKKVKGWDEHTDDSPVGDETGAVAVLEAVGDYGGIRWQGSGGG